MRPDHVVTAFVANWRALDMNARSWLHRSSRSAAGDRVKTDRRDAARLAGFTEPVN